MTKKAQNPQLNIPVVSGSYWFNVFELDIQRLRETLSDAEFRKELTMQIQKQKDKHICQFDMSGKCFICGNYR